MCVLLSPEITCWLNVAFKIYEVLVSSVVFFCAAVVGSYLSNSKCQTKQCSADLNSKRCHLCQSFQTRSKLDVWSLKIKVHTVYM